LSYSSDGFSDKFRNDIDEAIKKKGKVYELKANRSKHLKEKKDLSK
jgi:hypothetical protein